MNCPVGMAMDKAGNLYVMDCLNSRVQKFRPRSSE
jgi:sugar lactone lactonase YvrE